MTPTKLLYLTQPDRTDCPAQVQAILQEHGRTVLILDQTVFYPVGEQPCDHGIILKGEVVFKVDDVRLVDGIMKHIGTFYHGTFSVGDEVGCSVDTERRAKMSHIHLKNRG